MIDLDQSAIWELLVIIKTLQGWKPLRPNRSGNFQHWYYMHGYTSVDWGMPLNSTETDG